MSSDSKSEESVSSARRSDIKDLNRDEITGILTAWREPRYRIDQLIQWLYERNAASWAEMSNLPRKMRERLDGEFALRTLELVCKQGSGDTTQKFLWRLCDGAFIESVLIPANPALYGESSDRHTLCVSTQVGCAYGCKFCASGLDGWKRNLDTSEIIEQVLSTERLHATQSSGGDSRSTAKLINNLVIMGMGEPLANYDNLVKALKILNAEYNLGARKITVSTSGLVPEIKKLADEPHQFRLAISLHGATDEVRSRIMPVNRKYPLEALADACEYYQRSKGRKITFEYILIAGVNDGLDQVQPLADLSKRLNAKVNLIPYNKVEGLPWERPDESTQDAFADALIGKGVTATLRREKGHDIDAACGQLRLKTIKGEDA